MTWIALDLRVLCLTVQVTLPCWSTTVTTLKMLESDAHVRYFSTLLSCLIISVHVATCTEGDVRLIVSDNADTFYTGETMYDSSYYNKDGLRVGRVEVCIGQRYGTVCDDGWDDRDASVVCRQLTLSPYGMLKSP